MCCGTERISPVSAPTRLQLDLHSVPSEPEAPPPPPPPAPAQRDTETHGSNTGRAERMQQKNKNLLGLVSNLQPLSSHQRKTAHGERTVRACWLERITALKGSEAKQHYEFSCRVMGGALDLFISSSICLSIAFIGQYWSNQLGNTLVMPQHHSAGRTTQAAGGPSSQQTAQRPPITKN